MRLVHSGWENVPLPESGDCADLVGNYSRRMGRRPRRLRRQQSRRRCGVTVLQLIAHSPGPAWVSGVPFREQPGVDHHLATMKGWLDAGHLVVGGPFLDGDGGGVAIVRFESVEEADAAAQADRAVKDGLVAATTRPGWRASAPSTWTRPLPAE